MIRPPLFLFGHQVTVKTYFANDAYGQKVYTQIDGLDPSIVLSYDSVNGQYIVKCRFEPNTVTNRRNDGEQKDYRARLFTLGTNIPTQSTIIYENEKYVVDECIKHTDLTSVSYLEVLLS